MECGEGATTGEGSDQAGEQLAREGLRGAEREDAGAAFADFIDLPAGDRVASKDVGSVAVEAGSGGRCGRRAGAREKRRAELDFQPADRLRDRRLGEVRRFGRAGEAVVIDDGLEERQRVGVDDLLLEKLIESSIESISKQRPDGVRLRQ